MRSMKPGHFAESAPRRRLKLLASLAASWLLVSGAELGAQTLPAPETSARPPALSFEVLAVTVGSGSRSQGVDGAVIHFGAPPANAAAEVAPDGERWARATVVTSMLDLGAERPMGTLVASMVPVVGASGTAAPVNGAKGAVAPTKEGAAETVSIVQALEEWHRQVLVNYTYTIGSLADPFLPIKEVRGQPNQIDAAAEANLPPILRLELNQLKLVAITILSGGSGAALASFEDGAGMSYILREGDRIGRNQGRIVTIDPSRAVVEEPPLRGQSSPRLTEMKLDVLSDTPGLTREGE